MSSFPGMRKLRITANDTKSLATKYSQAHFIYGNTEWFTAYLKRLKMSENNGQNSGILLGAKIGKKPSALENKGFSASEYIF